MSVPLQRNTHDWLYMIYSVHESGSQVAIYRVARFAGLYSLN